MIDALTPAQASLLDSVRDVTAAGPWPGLPLSRVLFAEADDLHALIGAGMVEIIERDRRRYVRPA